MLERDKKIDQEITKEENCKERTNDDNGKISIHALKGITNNKIIKVECQIKRNGLMILIDSESTHNFLDENTTKRLKCQLTRTPPLSVTVTNGQRVMSTSACNEL